MKQLTCEMCGSTDLVKQDGIFVCQTCGTKYSIEEAKKMMVEGTVDVSGSTVKVDVSEELQNYYKLARRALARNKEHYDPEYRDLKDAMKYYEMILEKDPDSWEANYYINYHKVDLEMVVGKIKGFLDERFLVNYKNCLAPVLIQLSKINDEKVVQDSVVMIFHHVKTVYGGWEGSEYFVANSIQQFFTNRAPYLYKKLAEMMYSFADNVLEVFGDKDWACEIAMAIYIVDYVGDGQIRMDKECDIRKIPRIKLETDYPKQREKLANLKKVKYSKYWKERECEKIEFEKRLEEAYVLKKGYNEKIETIKSQPVPAEVEISKMEKQISKHGWMQILRFSLMIWHL